MVKTKQRNPQQDSDLLRARQKASDAIKDRNISDDCDDEVYSIASDSDGDRESSNESDSDTGTERSSDSDIPCHSSECESDFSDDDFIKPKKKIPTLRKEKGHPKLTAKHASNESAVIASKELMVILTPSFVKLCNCLK